MCQSTDTQTFSKQMKWMKLFLCSLCISTLASQSSIQLKEEDHKTLSIARYSIFDIAAQKQESQPNNCMQHFNSL